MAERGSQKETRTVGLLLLLLLCSCTSVPEAVRLNYDIQCSLRNPVEHRIHSFSVFLYAESDMQRKLLIEKREFIAGSKIASNFSTFRFETEPTFSEMESILRELRDTGVFGPKASEQGFVSQCCQPYLDCSGGLKGTINGREVHYDFNSWPVEGIPRRIHNMMTSTFCSFMEKQPQRLEQYHSAMIESDDVKPEEVSLEALLKAPSQYDGKRVVLRGWFTSDIESSRLSVRFGSEPMPYINIRGASTFADATAVEFYREAVETNTWALFTGVFMKVDPVAQPRARDCRGSLGRLTAAQAINNLESECGFSPIAPTKSTGGNRFIPQESRMDD